MGWNADRTSVGNQWGQGPVHIANVPAVVTIAASKATKIYALNSGGERTKELAVKKKNDQVEFEISPAHQTVWYEITK